MVRVVKLEIIGDYLLYLHFNDGRHGIFDAEPYLDAPAFRPLGHDIHFRTARVANGTVTWLGGELDIAPETLYAESESIS